MEVKQNLETIARDEKQSNICTTCDTPKCNPMDLFSIAMQGACADCSKTRAKEIGFDATKNKYRVYIRMYKEVTVFAKDKNEAKEIAGDNFFPEDEEKEFEVVLIKEAIA